MKILFITPSPPNNLNRIRSKNIIKSLHSLGHVVTLVSLYKNRKEKLQLKESEKYTDRVIGVYNPVLLSLLLCSAGFLLPVPLRVLFCFSSNLRKALKKINDSKVNYDVVYVKRLRMAQYANIFDDKKVLVDITDSMTKYYYSLVKASSGLRKMLAIEEFIKHKWYEPRIVKDYHTVICSNSDKNYLVTKFNCSPEQITILENGIDMKSWENQLNVKPSKKLNNLLFWGVMNVETNELSCLFFLKEVMPYLETEYKFTIIGPKPSKKIKKYASDRIFFKGHVKSINFVITEPGIFICPMVTGAGVKNKIIQAAYLGLPIISTTLGMDGVDVNLKKYIYRADNPKEFIKQIKKIQNFSSKTLAKLLSEQRLIVENHYNIYSLIKTFDKQVLNKFL